MEKQKSRIAETQATEAETIGGWNTLLSLPPISQINPEENNDRNMQTQWSKLLPPPQIRMWGSNNSMRVVRSQGLEDGSVDKYLSCYHEDLNLDPRIYVKSLGTAVHTCNPGLGSRDRRIHGTCWPTVLTKLKSTLFRDPVKKYGRE